MSQRSARDAVETALDRASQPSADYVFTLRCDAQARAQADKIDAEAGAPSELSGALFSIKDNFDLRGFPTPAGSRLLADEPVAQRNAPVVDRLLAAGCILLGRTNMTEFAFSGLGLNPHYGTPRNPSFPNARRIPGGSSSGAAVSVALGLCRFAIGTDTGGSVRIPAGMCGLVGFKPTANSINRKGLVPLSPTLDGVGIIANNVADCASVFDLIRDTPRAPSTREVSSPLRLGFIANYVADDCTPEVSAALEAALQRVSDEGAQIERVILKELGEIPARMQAGTFPAIELAAAHADFLSGERAQLYDPRVLSRIRLGESASAAAYRGLKEWRRAFIAAFEAAAAGFDALVWPTIPFIAPSFDELAEDEAYFLANARALRNSTIANLADGCAISLPCQSGGAPIGLTLAAPHGYDDHLLRVAAIIHDLLQEHVDAY